MGFFPVAQLGELRLAGALVMGLVYGIGPCIAVCGPVILPYTIATSRSGRKVFYTNLAVVTGRVLSFMVLGFLGGLLGQIVVERYNSAGIFRGVQLLLSLMCILVGGRFILRREEREYCVEGLSRYVKTPLIFGVVMGFVPCPPLLAILSYVVLLSNPWMGMLHLFLFGIGTGLPLLALGGGGGWLAGRFMDLNDGGGMNVSARRVSGVLLIMAGIRFLLIYVGSGDAIATTWQ